MTQLSVPAPRRSAEAPGLIRRSTPLANRLLRAGMPMGPNVLLTVRGRVSGEPRTAPVAVIEIKGRRFVIGAYGDVQWIRNLRAAGEAELQIKGEMLHVTASELDLAAATTFYGETLPRYIASFPWFGRAFARVFFRMVGPELANDPERAAALHPVFELVAG
jgi:deazaflavin-dependent oxidoreductase (nitroreductase family)